MRATLVPDSEGQIAKMRTQSDQGKEFPQLRTGELLRSYMENRGCESYSALYIKSLSAQSTDAGGKKDI